MAARGRFAPTVRGKTGGLDQPLSTEAVVPDALEWVGISMSREKMIELRGL